MITPEEEVLLAAADVAVILLDEARIRARIGDIHYDRMQMPYVWLTWSIRNNPRTFADGRNLYSTRRERLRVDLLPTGVALTRWDMGSVAARGMHSTVMDQRRRALAARRVINRMIEDHESLVGPHYWKATELLDIWRKTLWSLSGQFDYLL